MAIRKIYFMGIKGVGMATLAIIAKQAGFVVAGSDVQEEFITDKILKENKIDIKVGFNEKNVEDFVSTSPPAEVLLIATGAHNGFENPETVYARQKGIKILSHGQAVGYFMSGEPFGRKFEGISIAGAHGKTTIAGMVSFTLSKLGSHPSYTVGTSEIIGLGPAGHFGSGKYFIAEADEYISEPKYDKTPKFLYQNPSFLIVNNIDFDHPDVYANLDEITEAYRKFVHNLGNSGFLIANGDDAQVQKIIKSTGVRAITYGTGIKNEFQIENFKQDGLSAHFSVKRGDTPIGSFQLSIPGYHNAKNALGVIALLIELGFPVDRIEKALSEFNGTARRFQKIGETSEGVLIYDDYAHHPEEIKKTLEAAKGAFPTKQITVVFQAHTFARTRALLSEFASSFRGASQVIILPTFASMRDSGAKNLEEDRGFVERVRLLQPNVFLIENPSDVVKYLKSNVRDSNKIIMTMGAGDVYKIGYGLVDKLKK